MTSTMTSTIAGTRPGTTWQPAAPTPLPTLEPHRPLQPGEQVVLFGDFGCPWSYLAYRRAAVLAGAGRPVDWRAVEHSPWTPGVRDDRPARYRALVDELTLVTALLAPGEELPVAAAGFAPHTRATVAAYAEAHAAGVSERALRLLFEAYWEHGADVGSPVRLRALLQDELRGSASPSPVVREWGHAVDVGGGPVSTFAWRLVRGWEAEWRRSYRGSLPVVHVGSRPPMLGTRGVEWLGQEILSRGLGFALPPLRRRPAPSGLPSRSWISGFGGSWHERSQRATASDREMGQARSTR